jgi:4'-phosphopantetheinyl transferase
LSAGNWETPATGLTIHPSEVHIWRAGLELPERALGDLAGTLAADEQLRASRFRFGRHRDRYVAGRGILRSLIGRYLTCDPAEIRFEYGVQGKPSIASPKHGARLDFNLGHSDDLALFAFCLGRKIGIDLERERDIAEMPQLVSRNFSSQESAAWRSLPPGERKAAFFNCWVRKEAFIKAIGEGLSYPLQEFDVSLIPGDTPELLSVSGDANLANEWSLLAIEAAGGFAAAAVVQGSDWEPRYLQFG